MIPLWATLFSLRLILCCFIFWQWFYLVYAMFNFVNAFIPKQPLIPPTDLLLLLSARSAAKDIRERKIRSEDLVRAYITRIKDINEILNALVVEKFSDAIKQASYSPKERAKAIDDELDKASPLEIEEIARRRPLLGVPLTVKDSFDVEGYRSTNGVWVRRNNVAQRTAPAIESLQKAGCVLLGTTNVGEACYSMISDNRVFGRTNNPYDPRRTPGGTAGGEGALLGAAASLVGLGSDIAGSIRVPAHFNGIFGLKTSLGLAPNTGHNPAVAGYPSSMITFGPMCRYAEDLEPITRVLAGEKADRFRLGGAVDSIRLFYMDDLGIPVVQQCCPDTMATLHEVVSALEKRFETTAEKLQFDSTRQTIEMYLTSAYSDWNAPLKLALTDGKGDINPAVEILKLVYKKEFTLPALAFAMNAELCEQRDQLALEIRHLLGGNGIIICPSYPTAAPFHNQYLATPFNVAWGMLFNMFRLPIIQCPAGFSKDGMPIGLQIIGPDCSDGLLIKLAEEMEELFGGWKITPESWPLF